MINKKVNKEIMSLETLLEYLFVRYGYIRYNVQLLNSLFHTNDLILLLNILEKRGKLKLMCDIVEDEKIPIISSYEFNSEVILNSKITHLILYVELKHDWILILEEKFF